MGTLFDANQKNTGLKTAVKKIIDIVNDPGQIAHDLKNVMEQTEIDKAIKNISGVGAGHYDYIKKKSMEGQAKIWADEVLRER